MESLFKKYIPIFIEFTFYNKICTQHALMSWSMKSHFFKVLLAPDGFWFYIL